MPTTWRDRPWVAARQAQAVPGFVQPTDPQHGQPAPDMVPGQITWVADTLVPTLPPELMGDQMLQLPVMGGPLDLEPQSHAYGLGGGPGLDELQTQQVTDRWHEQDRGATAARRYQPVAARDGAYHVDIIPDGDADTSPETVALRHETGVGRPNDPHARRAQRIWRWRERFIDRHMWGTSKRPAYLRNAYTPPITDAPTSQYSSPFPGGGVPWATGGMGTPDKLVAPQERRTPRPWDEAFTVDATDRAAADHGLGSWGL